MPRRTFSSNVFTNVWSWLFTRSHLFATITMPRPARSASPPIAASRSAGPAFASITSATTSASAIDSFASATLTSSTFPPVRTRPGRRMPAVSMMRKCRRCQVSRARTRPRRLPDDELVRGIIAGAEQATGVEQLEALAAPDDGPRERIARRAGDWRDDRAPAAGHRVEQRGFSDVRAADEDDRGRFTGHSQVVRTSLSLSLDSVSLTIYSIYKPSGDSKHDQGRHRQRSVENRRHH